MRFKTFILTVLMLGMMLSLSAARAMAQVQPKTIGISEIRASKSLVEASARKGADNDLRQVLESLDGQLTDRFQNTNKFKLVNRNEEDFKNFIKEFELTATMGNPNDKNRARMGEVKGCEYLVFTTIDGFNVVSQELVLPGGRTAGSKRRLQLSGVVKLYHTTTQELLTTANFQVENKATEMMEDNVTQKGDSNEKAIPEMSRMFADKVVNRVVDVLFPMRVVARTDNVVTINRGDGTNIAVGQTYAVYAVSDKPITDPDTGVVLGKEEIKVGAVRVISVAPMMSQAEIIEDKGVDKGHILRAMQGGPVHPGAPAGQPAPGMP